MCPATPFLRPGSLIGDHMTGGLDLFKPLVSRSPQLRGNSRPLVFEACGASKMSDLEMTRLHEDIELDPPSTWDKQLHSHSPVNRISASRERKPPMSSSPSSDMKSEIANGPTTHPDVKRIFDDIDPCKIFDDTDPYKIFDSLYPYQRHGCREEQSDDPLLPVFFGFMRQLCKDVLSSLKHPPELTAHSGIIARMLLSLSILWHYQYPPSP